VREGDRSLNLIEGEKVPSKKNNDFNEIGKQPDAK